MGIEPINRYQQILHAEDQDALIENTNKLNQAFFSVLLVERDRELADLRSRRTPRHLRLGR